MVGLALSLKSAVMVFVALLLMYLFILSFRDEAYANSTDGRPAPTASLPVVVIGDKVLDLHNRGNYLKSKVLRIDAPGDMAAHKHKHNGNNKRQFQSPGTPEFEKDLQLPIEQQQQQQQQQQQEDDEDNDVQDQGEENLVSIIEHTPLASVVVRAAAEAEQPTLIASSTQHEIKVNRVDPQEIELENAARELVKHGRFLNEGPTYDSKVAVSGAPVIDWSSTYFPLHETLSAEQVLERQQYFLDSRWSYVDYGGGYQSPNDLRYASRTTIAIFYTQPHVVELRRIVGDLHFFAFGRRIVIYTTHLSDDQLWEVGRFMHAAVFKLSEPLVDADAQSIELARTDAYRHARYFFGPSRCRLFDGAISHCTAGGSIGVAFLPPSTSANKYLCRLDQLVQEQAKHAYSASAEQAPDAVQIGFQQHAPFCGTTPEPYAVCLNPHEFLTYNPHAGGDRTLGRECSLHLRLDMPKPARPALPNTGKDKFCFCVAAFSSPNAGIQDQTIVADFAETLPTVLPSIKDFDFYIYAGTQIDPIWDSPERREQILKAMRQKFGPELDIPIRLFRYPLNPSLYDITFKFNSILLQAVADGCDYVYQFSDDFRFQTSGWPTKLVNELKHKFHNYGAAGLWDDNNPGLMSLSIAHRSHVERFGFYWAPRFKNWFSDNYMQELYDERLAFQRELNIFNSQRFGQRYMHCFHRRVYYEEIAKAHHFLVGYFQRELAELEKLEPKQLTAEQQQRITMLPDWIARSQRLQDKAVGMVRSRGLDLSRALNQQDSPECPHDAATHWETEEQLGQPYFGRP